MLYYLAQTGLKYQIIKARARPELENKNPAKLEARNIQDFSSSTTTKNETKREK